MKVGRWSRGSGDDKALMKVELWPSSSGERWDSIEVGALVANLR